MENLSLSFHHHLNSWTRKLHEYEQFLETFDRTFQQLLSRESQCRSFSRPINLKSNAAAASLCIFSKTPSQITSVNLEKLGVRYHIMTVGTKHLYVQISTKGCTLARKLCTLNAGGCVNPVIFTFCECFWYFVLNSPLKNTKTTKKLNPSLRKYSNLDLETSRTTKIKFLSFFEGTCRLTSHQREREF